MRIVTIFTTILLCSFSVSISAQTVKTKDGLVIGKRDSFISACSNNVEKEMKIRSIKMDAVKYCICFSDNVIPTIDSRDFSKNMTQNDMLEILFSDANFDKMNTCLKESVTSVDNDFKFGQTNNPQTEVTVGVKMCVSEVMQHKEVTDIMTKEQIQGYCECALGKVVANGYTLKDLESIEDTNSTGYNEIVVPCMNSIIKSASALKRTTPMHATDLSGNSHRSTVPLVDLYGTGYKVKISVGGISKYFLLDTGATDLVIDRETEKELLIKGFLKKDSYLNKTEYTLANKQKVTAQMVSIDNVVIGDYTLNNVVVAIIDDSLLLCGKSFLDKFSKWELDKNSKLLVLTK